MYMYTSIYLSQLHLLHVYRLMSKNWTLYKATYRLLTPFSKHFKMCALDIGTPENRVQVKILCRYKKWEVSGGAAPLSGHGSPQHNLFLLIALTISIKHGPVGANFLWIFLWFGIAFLHQACQVVAERHDSERKLPPSPGILFPEVLNVDHRLSPHKNLSGIKRLYPGVIERIIYL